MPGLEEFVRSRWAHYEESLVSTDPGFAHAHVTVLGPFHPCDDAALAPEVAQLVAGVASDVPAWEYTLARVATFPDGIIHLVPEPDQGFRELTRRICAQFPGSVPYDGQHADPRPHLTLDLRADGVTEETTRSALGDRLPRHERAQRLDLAWYETGRCHVLGSWELGAASAGPR